MADMNCDSLPPWQICYGRGMKTFAMAFSHYNLIINGETTQNKK